MAQTTVRVRTVQDACVAVGWTGHRTLTIDRPEQAGGMGLGFNGGELLLLAIGGCYCNDIFWLCLPHAPSSSRTGGLMPHSQRRAVSFATKRSHSACRTKSGLFLQEWLTHPLRITICCYRSSFPSTTALKPCKSYESAPACNFL